VLYSKFTIQGKGGLFNHLSCSFAFLYKYLSNIILRKWEGANKYKYKVTDHIEILGERVKQMEKELASINTRINTYKDKIKKYEQNIKIINEKRVSNKTQETLFALEELNNQRLIQGLQDKIEELQLHKQRIRNIDLRRVKLEMTEPYTRNTRVLGRIEVSEDPVAPNKKLIIAVAFVTGIILSVFLIFFIEFIKGFKDYAKNK